MRLRNIPSARQELDQSPYVIKEECYSQLHGNWARVFGNDNPVRIEIGMGKGQFLLELAGRNPEMNYVGIERYSSVLVHPVRRLAAAQRKGAVILGNGSGQETGNEAVREGGLDTAMYGAQVGYAGGTCREKYSAPENGRGTGDQSVWSR